jgi:hypothetical protein
MPGRITPIALLVALSAGGTADASPFRPLPGEEPRSATPAGGARPRPSAQGREFATLDEYLAFRRNRGAIDRSWYKEVAPDVFELQTTRQPAPPVRRFTRAELARTYGFDR